MRQSFPAQRKLILAMMYSCLLYTSSLLKDTVPALRYDGSIPFAQWQKQAREKLAALLGLPYKKPADHIIMEYDRMEPDFREIRFSIESEKGYFVPCHLLIPKDASAPLPVVICLQGHSRGMHVSLGLSLIHIL